MSNNNENNKNLKSWGNVQFDLKNALDTWTELTETQSNKLSPEQEQLNEVKRLLSDLKSKIDLFENSSKK